MVCARHLPLHVGERRPCRHEAAVAKQKALLAKAWESRSEAAKVKTPYEALTLASIIEKETGLAH